MPSEESKTLADDISAIKEDMFHLARLGIAGNQADVQLFVRKLARRHQRADTAFAARLMGLLRQEPVRGSPLRRAEPASLPLDFESRLPLLRLAEEPVVDVQPMLHESTWGALRQLVSERQRLDLLERHGMEPTRSVLFTGEPGMGKTLSAKWLAIQLRRPLATLDLSAVMSSFLGRTGNNVRGVLEYARTHDCVLLLDELDAVAKRRDDSTEVGELKRLVTVLLQEIDDWPSTGLLIAATNHPRLLDPAVWRRFEMVVEFHPPTCAQLEALARATLPQLGDTDWPAILAILLEGVSYAEFSLKLRRAIRRMALGDRHLEDELVQLVDERANGLVLSRRIQLATKLSGAGLSQRRVSDLTGVSRDTIRKHERRGTEEE